MITGARLVDLDGTELLVFGDDPLRLQAVSVSSPDVRVSSAALPGRDGEDDTTRYVGGAGITLDVSVQDNDALGRDLWLDRIRGYCRPGLRLWLHLSSTDWPEERRTLVRGDQAPLQFTQPGVQKVTIGFRAPRGVWESVVEQSQVLFPLTGASGGLSHPVLYPKTYEAGNVAGAAVITNGGTVPAFPYFDIYGFCTNPVVKNQTTGEQLGFVGLTVQAGDFLRVDLGEQVALLSNTAGQSRYSLLDFTTLTWWSLPPGDSQVAFVPTNPGPTCQAVMRFRNTMN